MPVPTEVLLAGAKLSEPIAASIKIERATGDRGIAQGLARPATVIIRRNARNGLIGPFQVATNQNGLHQFTTAEFTIPRGDGAPAYVVSVEKAVVSNWTLIKSQGNTSPVIEHIELTAGKVELWANGEQAKFELEDYEI